jgi:outer membrane scaffolding protein for murein synthesis (MipA/OmpV family)
VAPDRPLDGRWRAGLTRLSDEVASSLIVRRGSRDALIAGVGLAYT